MPATTSHTGVFDHVVDAERPTMIIKNTFIEMISPAPRSRRSVSLPTSPRKELLDSVVSVVSDASTDAEASVEPASDAETAPSFSGPSAAAPAPPPTALAPWAAAPAPSAAAPADAVPRPRFPQPARSLLNPRATAWAPAKGTQSRTRRPFHKASAAIVATVKAALAQSTLVESVEALEGGRGWTVAVRVALKNISVYETILTTAKEALLKAADASAGAFVMGFHRAPFLSMPGGFSALLGVTEDKSLACWDAFGRGMCLRGSACKWQHPQALMPVSVFVEVVVPAAPPRAGV